MNTRLETPAKPRREFPGAAAMTEQDFDYIQKLLKEKCALVLDSDKQYLVATRLKPIVKQLKLESITELVGVLRKHPNNGLSTQVIEAMMTTETSFFRDHHPFETLRKTVLPELIERRRQERSLTIWCAASSTGQEPYSLALLIREHFPELAAWNIKLLASDLSGEVLERATVGRYNQIEVNRGLPAALLVKYFEQEGTSWQLQAKVRAMVKFQKLNLAQPWPFLPRMDLVLLRNVMIYFDVQTKKSILSQVSRLLRTDGYLVLGGAETTINLVNCFRRLEHLKSGFYQLVD
jgi:chemotaxis protein methyltransferase CheR